MKTLVLKSVGRRIGYPLILLAALAFVAVSCEKEETLFVDEVESTELTTKDGRMPNGITFGSAKKAPVPGDQSIAAIAIDAGFSELVGALIYVDDELNTSLVDLFSTGTDQYTVFAPTNDAFFALYDAFDDVDEITDLPAELVLDVLLYHVVEGRRASNSVVPPVRPRKIMTLLGLTFTVNSSAVITDIAGQEINIVTPDISASNGIIHVIDGVLLPLE